MGRSKAEEQNGAPAASTPPVPRALAEAAVAAVTVAVWWLEGVLATEEEVVAACYIWPSRRSLRGENDARRREGAAGKLFAAMGLR